VIYGFSYFVIDMPISEIVQ